MENALLKRLLPVTNLGDIAVVVVNDKVFYYPYVKVDKLNNSNFYPNGFYSLIDAFNLSVRKGKPPVDMSYILDSGIINDREWIEVRKFFKTPILVYGHQLMRHTFGCFDSNISNNYIVCSGLFANPDISKYPLSKDMCAMDVYENILAAFCSDMEKKDPPLQPEYTRIEAAGFDLKESFRRRKE